MTKPNLATEIDRLRRTIEAQDATIRDLRVMVESLRPDAVRWRWIEKRLLCHDDGPRQRFMALPFSGELFDTPAQAVDRVLATVKNPS